VAHFFLFLGPGMDLCRRIAEIVTPTLTGMGYELVRVQISGTGRRTLQLMAERADRATMTVDDCADVSRAVSAVLDVEDPIDGSYLLEVSSPGLDRPLTRRDDFVRFAGEEVKVESTVPVEGRKRFTGRLLGLDAEDAVGIALDEGGEVRLPLSSVARAKLVLTEALLKAAERRQAQE